MTKPKLIGFLVGAGLLFLLILKSPSGFVVIVDHANLLFHEAGHVFVGFLSRPLEPYGGTIGQLTFPLVAAVSFYRKDQALPLAAAAWWFFENWLNIAHYMADARALVLPLVGDGEHDWNTIFGRWDLLVYDTRIAAAVRILGWAGMGSACAWVLWRAFQERRVASKSDLHPNGQGSRRGF